MKTALALAAVLGLLAGPALAQPPAAAPAGPAPAAAAAKLSADSAMKDLLASEPAKAVLAKHIPMIVEFFDSGQASGLGLEEMTLKALHEIPQAQSDGGLTAEALATISADLAKL